MSLFDRDVSAGRTAVSVLTGFLGSGKTTLLNHLLRDPALGDSAVIINEFGEIGLDHLLVERVEGEMVVLQSGCICCTVRTDLEEALRRLLAARDAAAVPPFRRVMIETTGLADPAPIMQMLLAHPLVAHFCTLDRVIATCDALYGEQHLREHAEARKQIALADRIVLTKLDLAPAAQPGLAAAIRALNARAPLLVADHGRLPVADLLEGAPSMARLADELEAADAHRHDEAIQSFVLTAERPLDWQRTQAWLAEVRAAFGPQLLRVKGLLHLQDEALPVVIHGVHHVFHPPVVLDRWPSDDRRTRIVFIARELDPVPIATSFASLVEVQ